MINGINHSNSINSSKRVGEKSNVQFKNITAQSGLGLDFQAMLEEQLGKNDGLKFSKHAKERAEQRGIHVTSALMDSLNNAASKARDKGAKDVVMIGEKEAFIVNIQNNVVVTTMSGAEMKNNIFTNIDSAVLL